METVYIKTSRCKQYAQLFLLGHTLMWCFVNRFDILITLLARATETV